MTFKDVTATTFMTEVVDRSFEQPVIVDFWAQWCGPCKQLGPILEKVVGASDGAVLLVKVDIDENGNPEFAQSMGILNIPAVYAFKKGQVVDHFVGAQPESVVKQFVRRIGGDGGVRSAVDLYAQIYQRDPGNIEAFAGLAHALIAGGDVAEARQLLDLVLIDPR